jgi:hypothetical protein
MVIPPGRTSVYGGPGGSVCPSTKPHIKAGRRSADDIPPVIPDKTTDQYDSATLKNNYLRAAHSLRKVSIIYMIGGLAYAIILALPWMLFADGGFVLTRFLWLVLCYSWPVVIAVSLIEL